MKKIELSNTKKTTKLYMAPMAGITDRAFREITTDYGADICFTEMVNVKGLYYGDVGTDRLLDMGPEEKNVGIQIFGRDVEIIERVIYDKLNNLDNIKLLDFNIGCPAPKIFKNREGSYLMSEPELVGAILETMVKTSKVPVSAKIRLGINPQNTNYKEIAKVAEEAGVCQLTLHGRTRDSYYSGEVNLEAIKEVVEMLDIPVIGNGDIFSADDAIHMLEYTKCDSIMIARGALGNPFIFSEIKAALNGETIIKPDLEMRREVLLRHYEKIREYKPEHIAIREMRKHAAWYLKGLPGSNIIKNKINTAQSMEEVLVHLDSMKTSA